MDVRQHLRSALETALVDTALEVCPETISVERPANPEHGDWSTNIALATAKRAGRKPRELAEALAARLNAVLPTHVESVEVAGAGFINFCLSPSWLHETLRFVVAAGTQGFARSRIGAGRSVNIEYVSANPTGPLHAGHGRWAAYGDSLARLFEHCGYAVTREFYVNDRGKQTQLFGESLAARKAGEDPPEGGYLGEYISEWAEDMPADADPVEWGLQRAHQDQLEVLASMNARFDYWASEKGLVDSGAVEEILNTLDELGYVYILEGATWLRTTQFGDSQDRVLIKSDGQPTYFLPDIAYHHQKYSRGELLIDILGADHHGYVSRMSAALQMLGHPAGHYEALIGQHVTVLQDGRKARLAKRAGKMVQARELVELAGADVARLTFLLQSIDTTQTIDVDLVVAESNENPVYYVQYANARVHSLARRARQRQVALRPLQKVDLSLLTHQRELALLRVLSELPNTVERAMRARAPHQVTTWSRECAAALHGFWHDCPILRDDVDEQLCQARLWLSEATRIGLSVGLGLLGVSAPESM
ncbi:MAG: arginine--tRNA ligase [Acidimicrobiia bacterium]|nr:arginine--tRNA ligase [Acidimicrobiia bacterium]MCY4456444.1 arginine--tRNA ligase [Acidimicrobiaceae bacterium]